ncbi:MAG: ChbG/HpnK family deacetylase [bacterium]
MYKINTHEKSLIINADDFGYCNERDQAIINLLEKKKISSVSCLVNGSSFEENIHKLK